jgi:hypothetical protein
MDVEGSESGPIWGTNTEFFWCDWEKQELQSGWLGVPTEILNGRPNEYKPEAKFNQVASLIQQNIYKYLKQTYQIF